jgi:hypothetical protein
MWLGRPCNALYSGVKKAFATGRIRAACCAWSSHDGPETLQCHPLLFQDCPDLIEHVAEDLFRRVPATVPFMQLFLGYWVLGTLQHCCLTWCCEHTVDGVEGRSGRSALQCTRAILYRGHDVVIDVDSRPLVRCSDGARLSSRWERGFHE